MTIGPFLIHSRLSVLRFNPKGLQVRLAIAEAPAPAFTEYSSELYAQTFLRRIAARAAVDVASTDRFAVHGLIKHPERDDVLTLSCSPISSTAAETRLALWRDAVPTLSPEVLRGQIAYPNAFYSHGLNVVLCVLSADNKLSIVKSPPFDTLHPGRLHPGWVLPLTRSDFLDPSGLAEISRWWCQAFLKAVPAPEQVKVLGLCCDVADYGWFVPVLIDLRESRGMTAARLKEQATQMDEDARFDFISFTVASLQQACETLNATDAPYTLAACQLLKWASNEQYPKLLPVGGGSG